MHHITGWTQAGKSAFASALPQFDRAAAAGGESQQPEPPLPMVPQAMVRIEATDDADVEVGAQVAIPTRGVDPAVVGRGQHDANRTRARVEAHVALDGERLDANVDVAIARAGVHRATCAVATNTRPLPVVTLTGPLAPSTWTSPLPVLTRTRALSFAHGDPSVARGRGDVAAGALDADFAVARGDPEFQRARGTTTVYSTRMRTSRVSPRSRQEFWSSWGANFDAGRSTRGHRTQRPGASPRERLIFVARTSTRSLPFAASRTVIGPSPFRTISVVPAVSDFAQVNVESLRPCCAHLQRRKHGDEGEHASEAKHGSDGGTGG